jgi:TPR repeat protein
MSEFHPAYERYLTAVTAYAEMCSSNPMEWNRPDADNFAELMDLLQHPAEQGDRYCQYALATILHMGLTAESEEEFMATRHKASEAATRWWLAAAKQGFWPAVDNLLTSGTGDEAQRIRDVFGTIKAQRKDLIGSSHGMPVYGAAIMQELNWRLYGKVLDDRLPDRPTTDSSS